MVIQGLAGMIWKTHSLISEEQCALVALTLKRGTSGLEFLGHR